MNTFRSFLFLTAAMLGLASAAQAARETRPAQDFHSLHVSAPIELQVVQGDSEGLVLEGEDWVLREIDSFVEQGVLRIRVKPDIHLRNFGKLTGTVNVRRLQAVSVHGIGDIHAPRLTAQDFAVSIHGSGDVRIGTLNAAKLAAEIHGSGDIHVGGKAERLDLRISGSGDVRAAEFETREANVSIAGSGDARLWARDELRVRIAGSGDVRYRGDPRVMPSIAGSGTVKRL